MFGSPMGNAKVDRQFTNSGFFIPSRLNCSPQFWVNESNNQQQIFLPTRGSTSAAAITASIGVGYPFLTTGAFLQATSPVVLRRGSSDTRVNNSSSGSFYSNRSGCGLYNMNASSIGKTSVGKFDGGVGRMPPSSLGYTAAAVAASGGSGWERSSAIIGSNLLSVAAHSLSNSFLQFSQTVQPEFLRSYNRAAQNFCILKTFQSSQPTTSSISSFPSSSFGAVMSSSRLGEEETTDVWVDTTSATEYFPEIESSSMMFPVSQSSPQSDQVDFAHSQQQPPVVHPIDNIAPQPPPAAAAARPPEQQSRVSNTNYIVSDRAGGSSGGGSAGRDGGQDGRLKLSSSMLHSDALSPTTRPFLMHSSGMKRGIGNIGADDQQSIHSNDVKLARGTSGFFMMSDFSSGKSSNRQQQQQPLKKDRGGDLNLSTQKSSSAPLTTALAAASGWKKDGLGIFWGGRIAQSPFLSLVFPVFPGLYNQFLFNKKKSLVSLNPNRFDLLRAVWIDTAITTIQRFWRGFLVRRRVKKEKIWIQWLNKANNAATIIQNEWRRYLHRLELEQEAINLFIATCRKSAANIIHQFYKLIMEKRNTELLRLSECLYRIRQEAALTIQRNYRGFKARQLLDLEYERWLVTWKWDSAGKVVELVGTFTKPPWTSRILMSWDSMTKQHIVAFPRIPGRHEFKFLVDGEICCDGSLTVVSDGAGNYNNVVSIPANAGGESPCRR